MFEDVAHSVLILGDGAAISVTTLQIPRGIALKNQWVIPGIIVEKPIDGIFQ
jgi:hypothetical protein